MSKSTWIVSELYYPELTSTGQLLTELAEGLVAKDFNVKVICGQPSYASRGTRSLKKETKGGVLINRCRSTTLDKDIFLFRVVNMATLSFSVFFKCLFSFNKNDKVFVVTNPPSLPFIVTFAAILKRAKTVLIVHDVYPDLLAAAHVLSEKSILFKFLEMLSIVLYKIVSHVVVIGRDMEYLLIQKKNVATNKISFIPNWADTEQICPQDKMENKLAQELSIKEKFIVQYAGNMGYPHAIETILDAISKNVSEEIAFVFIGSGVKKNLVEEYANKNRQMKVFVLPNRPRTDQLNFLNACDVALISLVPGMKGVSVPSRTYNILASGKAVIALVDEDSEVGRLVKEEKLGWVVDPNDPVRLSEVIEEAYENPKTVADMGERARTVVLQEYTFRKILKEYSDLLESLDN